MKPSQLAAFLARAIQARAPVLIVGAPGVGKSALGNQASTAAGADLIIDHPAVADPTDAKGIAWVVDGKADFLPIGNLRRIVEATRRTVCFLDDLGQAAPAVQAAYMQLLLARRVGEHHVSDMVTFLAATNRRTDRAGVQGLLEPVKSRFVSIVTVEPDLADWTRWALSAGLPTELITFLRFRPSLLHAPRPSADLVNTPSPRTAENVGRLMQMDLPAELEYEAFAGAAGEGFAAELLGFLKIFRNLPNPDAILMNPDTAAVPRDPATLYALAGALARRSSDQTIDRLVRYYNRMPAEFSVLAMRDSVQVCPAVVNSRAYVAWASDHAEVLL